ncbi:MAG TPA: outer membrane protein assembly factor BamD, partial [Pirellulaceae bacterium]
PSWEIPFVKRAPDSGPPLAGVPTERPGESRTVAERVRQGFGGDRYDLVKARADYQKANERFNQAKSLPVAERQQAFAQAAKSFHAAARHAKGSTLEEDALMMTGEAWFFADAYPKAVDRYAELIKKYPTSRYLDHIDQRRFLIATHWLEQAESKSSTVALVNFTDKERPSTDTFGHAVKLLDRIRFDNPTGKLADDATMKAAVSNFERERYVEADPLFADIRDNFPQSPHQFQAHLLGLKCKQKLYYGAEYDGTVLDEAEKIIQQMIRLYPQESAGHQEHLATELKDLRLKKAERDFKVAKYYDQRKEYGAARVYYDLVRTEYKDTNLSLEAETRLAQIGGLPAVPENSMQWLADMFPTEEPAKPLIASEAPDTKRR